MGRLIVAPVRQWRVLLVCVWLGSISALGAEPEAEWKSPDRLVDAFVELALKSEYSSRETPVRKWTSPIRYQVVHHVGDSALHEKLIATHLWHMAQITDLDVALAATPGEANFLIVMTSDDRLDADILAFAGTDKGGRRERFFRDSMCLASLRADRSGAILRATAMIPVDRARGRGELVACVVEELTHMFGISNDTGRPLPSIFNHGTVRSFLTGLDYLVLKMLYDPRVRPGMKAPALRPLLQQIAVDLEQSGLVELADQLAAENGLAGACP
jgi:hypothetical protein